MRNKQTLEHLYRLTNILRLYNLTTKERDLKKEIETFIQNIDKTIISLYEIYISNNLTKETPILSIGESMTIEDKGSVITLLMSSREYIKTNRDELDDYIMNIIISKLSKLIYSLKLN